MWLKRNLTSAIESLQHIANTPFLGIIGRKKVNDLLKKADIYPYYDQNVTKLSLMYTIASSNEKKLKHNVTKAQQILKTLARNFRNVSK